MVPSLGLKQKMSDLRADWLGNLISVGLYFVILLLYNVGDVNNETRRFCGWIDLLVYRFYGLVWLYVASCACFHVAFLNNDLDHYKRSLKE